MATSVRGVLRLGLFCLLAVSVPSWAQAAGTAPAFGVSKESVFWIAFWVMTLLLVVLFAGVTLGLLRSAEWKLGDAISEEAGDQPDPLPPGQKPIMVASSSRLIALLGLLAILSVFIGFGYYFLYTAFAGNTSAADMKESMKAVLYYLVSGAVLFAPYLANQLRETFTSLTAPQPAAQPVQVLARSSTAVG